MYNSIPPARFILGGLILALPLGFMSDEWKWRYVALILVMFIVFNSAGLSRFASFISNEL